jgi:mono/diheme cytochrome c family protein
LAPAGETLVAQKACLGCHIIASAGGQVGPSLNGVVERKGVKFVRQKLRDPTFDNANSMMPNFGLTTEQVEAVTAYLATLN